MKREEGLEHIWSSTHENYRGYAGDGWRLQGRRTVLVFCGGLGTVLKLLDDLTVKRSRPSCQCSCATFHASRPERRASPCKTPTGDSASMSSRNHRRDPAMREERKRFYREMLGCHERHQELVLTLRL